MFVFASVFLVPAILYSQEEIVPARQRTIFSEKRAFAIKKSLDSLYGESDKVAPLDFARDFVRAQDAKEESFPPLQDKSYEEIKLIEKALDEFQKGKLELGSEASHIVYRESKVMKEEGNMYGFVASYTYRGWLPPADKENIRYMLRVEGKYSVGKVDYQNSGTINNIDDRMYELRGLFGSDFYLLTNLLLTPYVGVGYRYLNDDTSGMTSSTGAKGYERKSNYYYVPVGLDTTIEFDDTWSLGIRLEYDYFLEGKQISKLSNADPDFNDLENTQNKGYGLRASTTVKKRFGKTDLVFEPFIRYWNIDKSEISTVTYAGTLYGYGLEPKNNSTEYGIKLAVQF